MKKLLITLFISFAFHAFFLTTIHAVDNQTENTVKVAAVQFSTRGSVEENTDVMLNMLEKCANQDVRIVLFHECAVTGYDKKLIRSTSPTELLNAEKTIAEACKKHNLYAIVGIPYFDDGNRYNTAVVFDPNGETVIRYAKMQLVGGDDWAVPGEHLYVFHIDDIPCSIIICHDERYPELVRLPVMAGARLVFYPSSESSITVEEKLEPYRAQISARADENDVFIVQANNTAMASHGQSRIIGPDGRIIVEASMFKDEIITATLDMNRATGHTAKNSLRANLLREWWQAGIEKVIVKE